MKLSGQIIELDPSKEYIMIVKRGSVLARMLHSIGGRKLLRNGSILFTDTFKEFKLVENSERIVDIREEKNEMSSL